MYALPACALQRPEGAYDGDAIRDASAGATDSDPDSDEEIYRDAGSADADAAPPLDAPSSDDAGALVESPLIGDYWMRADVHTNVEATQLGLTVRTISDTTIYSLVTVRAAGAALEFRDYQCGVRVASRCESGCRSATTAFRDEATSARAFLAPRRTLELDDAGGFKVTRGPYAVGWRGDFGANVDLPLPQDEDDPLVYDPDGGGDGVDLTMSVRTAIGLPINCAMRIVQRVDVVYEGTIADERFAGGTLRDVGSAQRELSSSCADGAPEASEAAPATLRFVPAKLPIEPESLPWVCPTLGEFADAFE